MLKRKTNAKYAENKHYSMALTVYRHNYAWIKYAHILLYCLVWFVLFNDTWSQYGHSVPCMTILFINLQISRSDIRPHIKWAVSLVILHVVTLYCYMYYNKDVKMFTMTACNKSQDGLLCKFCCKLVTSLTLLSSISCISFLCCSFGICMASRGSNTYSMPMEVEDLWRELYVRHHFCV